MSKTGDSEHFCMVPWCHTYLSPQTERRLCCASREPAQNFQQYIDTKGGEGKYTPVTLEEHWNSEHMKDVRRRMMAGEQLDECQVCDQNPSSPYRDYFSRLFGHKKDEVLANTDSTGYTSVLPVSWDYRISNLCNFKCKMCGDMLSSSWETEMKKYNMVTWENPKNNWMLPNVRKEIRSFQESTITQELFNAVNEHRVEEIYWVGGEPLMMDEHWKAMRRIIELGDGHKVYARYNTNLSQIVYKGTHLFIDILEDIRDWEICASIDATGEIGEYIRNGLDYNNWLSNFVTGIKSQSHPNQMRLDLTVTLPGLFDIKNLFDLSLKLNVPIQCKLTFAFTPDIVMSPMCLPRNILNDVVDDVLDYIIPKATWKHESLISVLNDIKHKKNFEEEWPDLYKPGIAKGKGKILQLEEIRNDKTTMTDILRSNSEAFKWWDDIIPITEEEYGNQIKRTW